MLSYKKNADVTALKQKWAQKILKDFNIHLRVMNKSAQHNNLIVVGNHVGFLDIIVLMAAEPRVVFLSKIEVKSWPIIGAGARKIGTIFVNRNSGPSRAASRKAILSRLQSNASGTYIAAFPSGTTCLNEEKPWKKGLFEIAAETSTPVQSFKLKYSPLRVCAYIEADNLIFSMIRLFQTPRKAAILEWGICELITDPLMQMEKMQKWTQPRIKQNEEKTFVRPASEATT